MKISSNINLFQRKNSANYQARIKGPDGKWRSYSTGTDNLKNATDFANKKEVELEFYDKHDMAVATKIFRVVATKFLENLELSIQESRASESQKSYKRVAHKWLLPFFSDYRIDKIDYVAIEEFEAWRQNQRNGEDIPKSTINKHNIVLRAILEFALHRKWLTSNLIPKLTVKGKGVPSDRRGHFESEEWNTLSAFLAEWRKEGPKFITKYKRSVLEKYVHFLTATGVRPGEEALGIKWEDFQYIPAIGTNLPTIHWDNGFLLEEPSDDGEPVIVKTAYFRVYIKQGKKAGRGKRSNAHHIVTSVQIYHDLLVLKGMRSGEIKDTDLVFCLPDGSSITGLSEMFRNALTLTGLRYAVGGDKRTLYSCRHTYATWKLQAGKSYEQLKTQMNTSVLMLQSHYDHATTDAFAEDLIL